MLGCWVQRWDEPDEPAETHAVARLRPGTAGEERHGDEDGCVSVLCGERGEVGGGKRGITIRGLSGLASAAVDSAYRQ